VKPYKLLTAHQECGEYLLLQHIFITHNYVFDTLAYMATTEMCSKLLQKSSGTIKKRKEKTGSM